MDELEKHLKRYEEHFGANYPICFGFMKTEDEIVADIERCIDSNKPAQLPQYEEGIDY